MPAPDMRLLLPMRDGIGLETLIWLPDGAQPAPAVLVRTPYRDSVVGWIRLGQMRYVNEGYALIYQMIRGTGQSEGRFTFNSPAERTDGCDTIGWIADQSWCDGNVGMDGSSYGGMTQLSAAALRPPALKCIIPHVPSTEFFREMPYFGGAFARQHSINWSRILSVESMAELTEGYVGAFPMLAQRDALRRLTSRPMLDAANGVLAGDKLDHYRDLLAHPTLDDWWRERHIQPVDYAAMDLPTLIVTGNFNVTTGPLAAWRALEQNAPPRDDRQLLIGPWDHGQVYTGGGDHYGPFALGQDAPGDPYPIRLAFFDKHLKGKGDGPDLGAKARIFFTGLNRYLGFTAYPPTQTRIVELFLGSEGRANTYRGDGKLTTAPSDGPPDRMRADPELPFIAAMTEALAITCDLREQVRHGETLVYATEPQDQALTILGEAEVVVHVAVNTPDADLCVQLAEMRADGSIAMLGRQFLRLRYRDGFDREVLLTPGEPVAVQLRLSFVAHSVARGNRLALLIQPDLFPLVDPNPNTGEPIATAVRMQVAELQILHDHRHRSRLMLPVIDVGSA